MFRTAVQTAARHQRCYTTQPPPLLNKLLIANRGEIACRVAQTAKRLGVKTVAVYSDADANARHVQLCDEAVRVGKAPAKDSYLQGDVLLQVARSTGATAIHPGYGFLSENAEFAEACAANDVTFVGPPTGAIEAMGSKSASKRIMIDAGVPVVPGYHGSDQSVDKFREEANKMGYPVLIKAIMGGGGKGMRIVNSDDELEEAMQSSSREAVASFGDGDLLIEKYVTRPRHIEFQVFADTHGNVVHLFERDCSVQRRYQKVVEEAPAPGMDIKLREAMGKAAVDAARAVNYVGAGTVEFIFDCDTDEFYFMEMNTRLQVEHPVTELVTGQDLVEWQLKIASGHEIPLKQEEIPLNGHSFEARIYAENPRAGFLPHTGALHHLRPPAETKNVRVDTGVRQGDEVSIYYDPMIAKLIVWDKDRDAALRRINTALQDYQIAGLPTNIEFLQKVINHKAFAAGMVDTSFIEQYFDDLLPPREPTPTKVLAAFALCQSVLNRVGENWSWRFGSDAWFSLRGGRLNQQLEKKIVVGEKGDNADAEVDWKDVLVRETKISEQSSKSLSSELSFDNGDSWTLGTLKSVNSLPGGAVDVELVLGEERYKATVLIKQNSTDVHVFVDGAGYELTIPDVQDSYGLVDDSANAGALTAPMPGKIVSVVASEGDVLEKGDPIMIMEAMKMEHVIKAPMAGTLTAINFKADDLVDEKVTLAVVSSEEE